MGTHDAIIHTDQAVEKAILIFDRVLGHAQWE